MSEARQPVDPDDLPAVRAWTSALVPSPNWLSYATHVVGLDGAFVAARLIWPSFEVVLGCVTVRGWHPESAVAQWLEATGGDIRRTESVLSTVHLWDVFANAGDTDVEVRALSELRDIMASSWAAALAEAFPQRRFRVLTSDDPDDYGPTLCFGSA